MLDVEVANVEVEDVEVEDVEVEDVLVQELEIVLQHVDIQDYIDVIGGTEEIEDIELQLTDIYELIEFMLLDVEEDVEDLDVEDLDVEDLDVEVEDALVLELEIVHQHVDI